MVYKDRPYDLEVRYQGRLASVRTFDTKQEAQAERRRHAHQQALSAIAAGIGATPWTYRVV